METRCDEEFEATAACHDDRTDLKLISLAFGASGLGIRLSKSSWDPYPFVSHVDEDSIAQERGLLVGDCILKVDKDETSLAMREERFRLKHTRTRKLKQKFDIKTFKVNGVDCLGETIQNIAKQIHSPTDDDSNEVNLLLWRSTNAQVKFISTLFHCINSRSAVKVGCVSMLRHARMHFCCLRNVLSGSVCEFTMRVK